MRLRRKKNLDTRLENVKDIMLHIEGDNFYCKSERQKTNIIDFNKIFGNNNPVHLELGCGKGGFVIEMAKRYPEINFIAVEKSSNVIVMACEAGQQSNLPNIKFLNISIENILYYIPNNSINIIYLNFSCPFPKNTYANRRLTHHKFLQTYQKMLVDNGQIIQKTDNQGLFEFSLEQYSLENFLLSEISLDLHKTDCPDNIMTEYEAYFTERNMPIHRVKATKR